MLSKKLAAKNATNGTNTDKSKAQIASVFSAFQHYWIAHSMRKSGLAFIHKNTVKARAHSTTQKQRFTSQDA